MTQLPFAPCPTSDNPQPSFSRKKFLSRGTFQVGNPRRGLPSRRSGHPTQNQNRERINPLCRQKSPAQSPNSPQHPQRNDLARPPHHRQTRNRFEHSTVGIRTPQTPPPIAATPPTASYKRRPDICVSSTWEPRWPQCEAEPMTMDIATSPMTGRPWFETAVISVLASPVVDGLGRHSQVLRQKRY